jgi:Uncharacterised nucleotidyltransferase
MPDTSREVSNCFITPIQLAFLQAALTKAPDAIGAVEEWLASVRFAGTAAFGELEPGLRRMLPLLYRNDHKSIDASLRPKLREIFFHFWIQNQKLFCRLEDVLAWFQTKGIPTLVLKGAALSLLHYRDRAVRPTSDLDILVPEERVRETIALLHEDGWSTSYIFPIAARNQYFYRHIHAIPFTHPQYGELDLHWHVLQTATFRGADGPFWTDSVPLQVNKVETLALNPTDQLLHACVHGFAANVVAPVRWIADAITVLRTSEIDWSRLAMLARYLHVTVPLGATLAFLRARFQAEVPAEVVANLMSFRVPRSDQRYFEQLTCLKRNWRENVAYNWERHRRAHRDLHPLLRIAAIPRDLGSFAFYRLGKQVTRMLAIL